MCIETVNRRNRDTVDENQRGFADHAEADLRPEFDIGAVFDPFDGISVGEQNAYGITKFLPDGIEDGIFRRHHDRVDAVARTPVLVPGPADKLKSRPVRNCSSKGNRLTAFGIYDIDFGVKSSAVGVIGKRWVFCPDRMQRPCAVAHRKRAARNIRRFAVRIRRPAEEGIMFAFGLLLGQRHRFVPMNRKHRGRTCSAVGVEAQKVYGLLLPCGINRNLRPLLGSQSDFVLFLRGIHTPVLLVVDIPSYKVVIFAGQSEGFGRRQNQRTEGAFDCMQIVAFAVKRYGIRHGLPIRIKRQISDRNIIPVEFDLPFPVVIANPRAVDFGKISEEVISVAGRKEGKRGQRTVVSYGLTAAAATPRRIVMNRINVCRPYRVKRDRPALFRRQVDDRLTVAVNLFAGGRRRPTAERPSRQCISVCRQRLCGVVGVDGTFRHAFDASACAVGFVGIVRYGIGVCRPYRVKRDRSALFRRQVDDRLTVVIRCSARRTRRPTLERPTRQTVSVCGQGGLRIVGVQRVARRAADGSACADRLVGVVGHGISVCFPNGIQCYASVCCRRQIGNRLRVRISLAAARFGRPTDKPPTRQTISVCRQCRRSIVSMRRVCGIAFDCAACADRLIGIVRYGISICLPYRKKRNRTALLCREIDNRPTVIVNLLSARFGRPTLERPARQTESVCRQRLFGIVSVCGVARRTRNDRACVARLVGIISYNIGVCRPYGVKRNPRALLRRQIDNRPTIVVNLLSARFGRPTLERPARQTESVCRQRLFGIVSVCGVARRTRNDRACVARLVGIISYGISVCRPHRKKRNRRAVGCRKRCDLLSIVVRLTPLRGRRPARKRPALQAVSVCRQRF